VQAQQQALELMTLLWCVELTDPIEQVSESTALNLPEHLHGLHLLPCSRCHNRGFIGQVIQLTNSLSRPFPLVEELFFSLQPSALAIGLHSLFVDPGRTGILCVVSLDPDTPREVRL